MTIDGPEEVLQSYINTLGNDFGVLFYYSLNEWCDIWLVWKQFENLFGRGPERVDLLNRCAGAFFYRVDRHFFEAAVMAVCRLSDPPESMGKPNLTLRRFMNYMDTDARRNRMSDLLDVVSKTTEFARDWRNRHISHNDYDLRVGSSQATPLKEATRNSMNEAIAALHDVLKFVSHEFIGSGLHNEVIDQYSNEMSLLKRLYLGDEVFRKELDDFRENRGPLRNFPEWLLNQS